MMETIDSLMTTDLQEKITLTLSALKNHILTKRDDYIRSHRNIILDVYKSLAEHTVPTKGMQWSTHPKKHLISSLYLSYDRAFKCQQITLKNPSPENIHEWRKRSKYLRYQLLIIQNTWPAVFKSWESEMHRLTDLLGKANNLAVLERYLATSPLASKFLLEIEKLVQIRQMDLIRAAQDLGIKLFAEKPEALRRRIKAYLSQWPALD